METQAERFLGETWRERLHDNWRKAKYTQFQLPHPSHPEEAHSEAVYIIQQVGNYLVSGSRDKSIRIWNLETRRLVLPPLLGHEASVLTLQFDPRPENDLIISAGGDCEIILWRFSTGQLIRKIENAHLESILCLRFNDRFLVTGSKDRIVKVWDRKVISNSAGDGAVSKLQEEFSLLRTFHGHTVAVNAVEIDGHQIVSACGGRLIKIWDIKTGSCLKTIMGHDKGIASIQLSGQNVISGSSDLTIRIFDRESGAEVACLAGHSQLVRTIKISHEGKLNSDKEKGTERMVSGSYDGKVIIWEKDDSGNWTIVNQLSHPLLPTAQGTDVALEKVQQDREHSNSLPCSKSRICHLQFDNSRIICSSMSPVIFGWDFAH